MTMTAEDRARQLVCPLGPDVAPVNVVFPEALLFGPEDLVDMIAAAIRAAEQEAEQRGAERERESDREQADRMSTALAAAGYPVEAGPALVEALKLSQRATASFQEIGGPDWILVNEASDKTDAALARAKQEPQP